MLKFMPIMFSALFVLNVPFIGAQVQAPEKAQKTDTSTGTTEVDDTKNQTDKTTKPAPKESTNTADWVEVEDQKGLFKAMFPSKPDYKFEEIAIPNTQYKLKNEQYLAAGEQNATLVLVIFYPQEFIKSHLLNEEDIVKKIVQNQAARDPKAKIDLKPIQYKNHQAYSFRITTSKNILAGVMFLVNNIAYNLTYAENVQSFNEENFQYFLDHFELTPNGEKEAKF